MKEVTDMDPSKNLREQLKLACLLIENTQDLAFKTKAERLAELVLALNGWIQSGGELPSLWQATR